MSKTILITGAAGFLGSHLCDRFIDEGFRVLGMDNFITGDKDNIQHLFDHPNFHFIEHDVTIHIAYRRTDRLYFTFCISCKSH